MEPPSGVGQASRPEGPAPRAGWGDLALATAVGALAVAPFWGPALFNSHAQLGSGTLPFYLGWEAFSLVLAGGLVARRWARKPTWTALGAGMAAALWHLFMVAASLWSDSSPPGTENYMSVNTRVVLFMLFGSTLAAIPLAFGSLGALLARGRTPHAAGWVLLVAALPILLVGSMLMPREMLLLPAILACALVVLGVVVIRGAKIA